MRQILPPDRVAQKLMSEANMQNIMVLCAILALMEVVLAGSFCIVARAYAGVAGAHSGVAQVHKEFLVVLVLWWPLRFSGGGG